MTTTLQAILFDKDGTLFDFSGTWDVWGARLIDELSGGDATLAQAIARATRFNLEARSFRPDSPVIAGTNREAAELFASALPDTSVDALDALLAQRATEAPIVPSVPLRPLLTELRAHNLRLGVMTNDSEIGALAHLQAADVIELFDFVAGFDSGHGAKPSPAPLLAFANHVNVPPDRVAMVGDSIHDLVAGRAAGMLCVGVLTGPATQADLEGYADVILPDIGHLPTWLAGGQAVS